ncbi:Aminotransferase class-III [Trinorchestia longiramus]|nr:Aminotransferase class-III [Trinorchestia longiramus]
MWTSHGGGLMQYGRGQYLYDEAGAQYLDCINSTAQVGHCDAGVLATTCQQLGKLLPDGGVQDHDCEFERLLSNTLPAHLNTFFHCDSGTQAVDLAIRLSRLWCGKKPSKLNKSSTTRFQLLDATRGGAAEKARESSSSIGRRKSDPGTSNELSEFSKSYTRPPCDTSVSDDAEQSLLRVSSCSTPASGSNSASDANFPTAEDASSIFFSENRPTFTRKESSSPYDSAGSSSISHGLRQSNSKDHDSAFSMKSCQSKAKRKRSCHSSSESGISRLARGDVVVVEGSFHGCTDSVVKLSSRIPSRSQQSPRSSTYSVFVVPLLDLHRARCNSATTLQCPYDSVDSAVQKHLADCRLALQRDVGSGRKVACLLVEPHLTIQGCQHCPAAWLQGLYSLVREFGGLCISDEVQSGLGRLGDSVWGFQSQGVTPDIVVIAKGIGNGLPMAVTVTTSEIAATFGPLRSAYKCNTLQNAVGAAVLHSLHQGGLMHSAATTGRYLQLLLHKLQKKHPYVGDVRGRGLLQVVDIVWGREQRVPSAQIADFLIHKLRRVGVVIAREGVHKNVLVVMPPMTFDVLDAASLATKLDEALSIVPNTFGLDQPMRLRSRRPMQQPREESFFFLDATRPRMIGATYADVSFKSHFPSDSESPLSSVASYPKTQCHHQAHHSCSSHRHSRPRINTSEETSSEEQPRIYISEETSSHSETTSSFTSESPNDSIPVQGSKDLYSITSYGITSISDTSMGSTSRAIKRPLEDITTAHRSVQTTTTFDIDSDSQSPWPSSRDESNVHSTIGETNSLIYSQPVLRIDTTVHPSASVSLPEPLVQTSSESVAIADTSTTSHTPEKKADLFSNIILVERDVSPDYSKVSGATGTFVGQHSQRLVPPRQGLHGTEESSAVSSTMKTGTKNLHPNELPRTCEVLGTGLGMVQPVPSRPSAPPSPRVSYEDVD